jgi:hypothetical protein
MFPSCTSQSSCYIQLRFHTRISDDQAAQHFYRNRSNETIHATVQATFSEKERIMNTLGKGLAFAVAGFIVGFSLSSSAPVRAQGWGQPAYCGSNDGRYARCPAPNWRNAQLVAQKSNARCDYGQSWGFERGYIWVNNGCRGEFVEARGGGWGGPPGPPPGPGYGGGRIRCESGGSSYRFCPVGIGRGDVRIVSQLSSARCDQDRSWGWRPDGIWVDRGCRADFVVYPRR